MLERGRPAQRSDLCSKAAGTWRDLIPEAFDKSKLLGQNP